MKVINEEYLRKMFERDPDAEYETGEQKKQRLGLLDEYLSD